MWLHLSSLLRNWLLLTWQLPFSLPPAQSIPWLKVSPVSFTFASHSIGPEIGTFIENVNFQLSCICHQYLSWICYFTEICKKRVKIKLQEDEKNQPQLLWDHQRWSLLLSSPNLSGTKTWKNRLQQGKISPATFPSNPAKLCSSEGRQTGGNSSRLTCSPEGTTCCCFLCQLFWSMYSSTVA